VLKIKYIIQGIREGLASIRTLKKRKLFIFYTLLIWAMYLLQIYVGFSAMQATQHLSLKAACSVLTLATLAIIATPGGIGTFPLGVMETLVVYKIRDTLGKAFGWIMWGVTTAIIIVIGIICYFLLPVINKQKHADNQSNPG
jgi:magnesium-transporting ATPase (P-type)